jgi:excisionase family DNA binding protein
MPTGASSPSTPRLLLRVEEAAEALAVSRTALYGLLRSGDIPVVRIGRSVRVPVAALESYVAKRINDESVL